jgi:hypothetical protein
MAADLDEYMTLAQAAQYAGCSTASIRRRVLAGTLEPSHRIAGIAGATALLLFLPEDLDQHFEEFPLRDFGGPGNKRYPD